MLLKMPEGERKQQLENLLAIMLRANLTGALWESLVLGKSGVDDDIKGK